METTPCLWRHQEASKGRNLVLILGGVTDSIRSGVWELVRPISIWLTVTVCIGDDDLVPTLDGYLARYRPGIWRIKSATTIQNVIDDHADKKHVELYLVLGVLKTMGRKGN